MGKGQPEKAKFKKKLLKLRRTIRGELKEHSEDHWYCEKCDRLIVEPDGRYGRVTDIDGAVEIVQHYVECEFTKRRIELGLENSIVRRKDDLKARISDLESEISIAQHNVDVDKKELAALREDLLAAVREDLKAAKKQ